MSTIPSGLNALARSNRLRAERSRPIVVEYRRDLEAKCPRKASMCAHFPRSRYGLGGLGSPGGYVR